MLLWTRQNKALIDHMDDYVDPERLDNYYVLTDYWNKFKPSKKLKSDIQFYILRAHNWDKNDLSRAQKWYLTRLTNLLLTPNYYYYFVKRWVITLSWKEFKKINNINL